MAAILGVRFSRRVDVLCSRTDRYRETSFFLLPRGKRGNGSIVFATACPAVGRCVSNVVYKPREMVGV